MRTQCWSTAACTLVFLLAGESRSRADGADLSDPAQIMRAVYDRDTGDKMRAQMRMKIVGRSGRERVRTIQMRSIEFAGGTKQLLIFESPASVRNTALLSFDYDDGAKDDDQWLYLPSVRKATRISGAKKSGSFMASDFSYSDMTKQDPDSYDYQLSKSSVSVGGEDCWLITAQPKTKKTREETGYTKELLWVSKEKLIIVQIKAWVRAGKKIKYMKIGSIKRIDGIWVPHKYAARTTQNGTVESTTIIDLTGVKLNDSSVTEKDFTQRRLEQGI